MAKKQTKLKERLTNKYRMVILNEETFEERFSFKLSRLNVYVFSGLFSILLIVLTSLLISFTPLREYIPGYSSTSLRRKATKLADSLQQLTEKQYAIDTKMMVIEKVLKGEIEVSSVQTNIDSIVKSNKDSIDKHSVYASDADIAFRKHIENQDKFNVNSVSKVDIGAVLFSPVTGKITAGFNKDEQHYAVDIAVAKDAPVKAVSDGIVVFSEWSATTGFVIILDHGHNMLSVYKHNSQIFKTQGELVKSGEVIAKAGSDGTLSTGVHLHFELWYNGYPIDPANFMDFE